MAHSKGEQALNESEGNTPIATPVVEEKPTEEVLAPEEETKVESEEMQAETVEEAPEEGKKKGYEQRVRELVRQRDEEKAKAQSFAEKLAELTGSIEPQVGYQPQYTPPTGPIVSPGEEIEAEELERRIQAREQKTLQQADALAILRMKQQEAVDRINNEANEAIKSYPQLDPDSEEFDKELSESVTEAVEAHVRADPFNASVKNFVGKLMKPYQRAVTKEVGEVTENIAKQVSETALRPSSIKPKEKTADEKTLKELEEELGVVY